MWLPGTFLSIKGNYVRYVFRLGGRNFERNNDRKVPAIVIATHLKGFGTQGKKWTVTILAEQCVITLSNAWMYQNYFDVMSSNDDQTTHEK
jgi:hypothetical protein